MENNNIINILTKCFICLYWIVLIGHNIYNFGKMSPEAKKRNWWIKALILVNAIVIVFTFICIFY